MQLPAPVLDPALDNGGPVPSTDIRLTEPRLIRPLPQVTAMAIRLDELNDPDFREPLGAARRILEERFARGVATPRERASRGRAA